MSFSILPRETPLSANTEGQCGTETLVCASGAAARHAQTAVRPVTGACSSITPVFASRAILSHRDAAALAFFQGDLDRTSVDPRHRRLSHRALPASPLAPAQQLAAHRGA